jgi:demethylmenaquinone methyltransferase/2-methoxy-6-polyprenyl-1,4-benzoquinol methylase
MARCSAAASCWCSSSRGLKPLEPLYDLYSFGVLPWLASASPATESYRYLAESIRMHPDQKPSRR